MYVKEKERGVRGRGRGRGGINYYGDVE